MSSSNSHNLPPQSPLDPDRLYRLLPAYIRQRDTSAGLPLRALLRVITQPVNAIDLNIAQLYDNLFIETCQDWAVPYVADLIGYTPLRPMVRTGDSSSSDNETKLRLRMNTPRRDVANTLRNRRRKGTADVLQQIAWDVAGWPGRVIENISQLETSVSIVHQDLTFGTSVSLKGSSASSELPPDAGGSLSFSLQSGAGINDLALQVWRKKSVPVHDTQATSAGQPNDNRFYFHPFGIDMPLYAALDEELERDDDINTNPTPEPWQFPGPITRASLTEITDSGPIASSNFYGQDKSIFLWKDIGGFGEAIPADKVVPLDLSNWDNSALKDGTIGLDPETGRLMFPPGQKPHMIRVSYHYGTTALMGGGEYERGPWPQSDYLYTVGKGADGTFETITAAIDACADDANRLAASNGLPSASWVIEICDSSIYAEKFDVRLVPGQRLQIRARNGCRPVLHIPPHKNDPLRCSIHGPSNRQPPTAQIALDGLTIIGSGLQIKGAIAQVSLAHCTLVSPATPSLIPDDALDALSIDHCVLGSIQVRSDKKGAGPVRIAITDSIIDASLGDKISAISGNPSRAHAIGNFQRCTFFGETHIHTIALAENCIFTGPIDVTRLTAGQIRFSWISNALTNPQRLPPCVMCQPTSTEDAPPKFEDLRYGTPGYAALALDCPTEILHGADDGSELGAFHDLFNSVRLLNLQTRVQEFIPINASAKVTPIT